MEKLSLKDNIINFNKKATLMIDELAKIFPTFIIAQNIVDLKKAVEGENEEMINFFVVHVLKDKEKIYVKDINYFKNSTFNMIGENKFIIVELKKMWDKLSPANQEHLWKYMIYLCKKTEAYFELVYVKKKN